MKYFFLSNYRSEKIKIDTSKPVFVNRNALDNNMFQIKSSDPTQKEPKIPIMPPKGTSGLKMPSNGLPKGPMIPLDDRFPTSITPNLLPKGGDTSLGGPQKKNYNPIEGKYYFDNIEYLSDGTAVYIKGKEPGIFLGIHGAGHSGAGFALLAQEIVQFASLVAYDIRGHGLSKHEGGDEDLSMDTLVNDAIFVYKEMLKKYPNSTFVLLGHSLGGSIAIRTAKRLEDTPEGERLVAAVPIDVVEGTAMEYLPHMNEIIQMKPKFFKTKEAAVKWSVQSKIILNVESARISIPPQLKEIDHPKNGSKVITWKNDLLKSEKFWVDWFKGLTNDFLNLKGIKVLFIAARERLDKELEIAHIKGKFMMITFPDVGHSMMEDDPKLTAKNCREILERFQLPLSTEEIKEMKEVGLAFFKNKLKPYIPSK